MFAFAPRKEDDFWVEMKPSNRTTVVLWDPLAVD